MYCLPKSAAHNIISKTDYPGSKCVLSGTQFVGTLKTQNNYTVYLKCVVSYTIYQWIRLLSHLYHSGKRRLMFNFCSRCNDLTPTAPVYKALLSEHNRIAGVLYSMNPFWDDTTLFLETRRAVAAIIQHITYNEFLPVLLGEVRIFVLFNDQHLGSTNHCLSRDSIF